MAHPYERVGACKGCGIAILSNQRPLPKREYCARCQDDRRAKAREEGKRLSKLGPAPPLGDFVSEAEE